MPRKATKPAPAKKPSLKLLGRSNVAFPANPAPGILETFPNRNPHRDYWVRFDCAEFTSLCPVTGQPDFAVIQIRYMPDRLCVETKSLKFYLASYRNTPSFGEDIANRILADLAEVLSPRHLEVTAEFSPRGGIALNVEVIFADEIPF